MDKTPLVIDLDGTLIKTDMLHESILLKVKSNILELFHIPLLLIKGKAHLKRRLAVGIDFNPALLPYNLELIDWLKAEKRSGRRLVLCTASDGIIAGAIAAYLNIFDEVIASDGQLNVAGVEKADLLSERFGAKQFDYAGNSSADIPVWNVSRRAVIVNAPKSVRKLSIQKFKVSNIFEEQKQSFASWLRVIRLHQWLKNLLLFVPLLAGHQIGDLGLWLSLILAFLSFGFGASTVYIINDMLDLESDRLHPRKRTRPFASGDVAIWKGIVLAPILFSASIFIASLVSSQFLICLIVYFTVTCAYSFSLKKLVIVDCMTLAILYTMRIIAGAFAIGNILSFWLLAFSLFLFLSLAFVKRYAELEVLILSGKKEIHGRGYVLHDAPLVQTMGIAAGYVSVLILALYLNSDAVLKLYSLPSLIWGAVFLLLLWINWVWIQAHRGQMHDDPLVFAMKDPISLLIGAGFISVLTVSAVGKLW